MVSQNVLEMLHGCTGKNFQLPLWELQHKSGFVEQIPSMGLHKFPCDSVGEATEVQVVEPVSNEVPRDVVSVKVDKTF